MGGYAHKKEEHCLQDSTTMSDATHAIGTVCCTKGGLSDCKTEDDCIAVGIRPDCHKGTYEEAKQKCESRGLNLCSVELLKKGAGEARGCGFDRLLVWSSTTCDGNRRLEKATEM